jgi:hypothetical protein
LLRMWIGGRGNVFVDAVRALLSLLIAIRGFQ